MPPLAPRGSLKAGPAPLPHPRANTWLLRAAPGHGLCSPRPEGQTRARDFSSRWRGSRTASRHRRGSPAGLGRPGAHALPVWLFWKVTAAGGRVKSTSWQADGKEPAGLWRLAGLQPAPQPGLPTPPHGGVGSPSVTADRVTGQQSQPGGRQLHRLTGPAPRATGTQYPAGLCPSDPENGCVLGGTLDPPSQDTGRHEAQLDHQDRGQLTAAGSELHSPRSPDPSLPLAAVRLGPDRSLGGLQLSQPWNTRDSARVGLSPRGGAPETLAVCHPPETLAACHHPSCSQAPATPRGPITGDVLALRSPGAQGAQARKGGEGGSSHLPPRGRPRIN